MLLEMVLISHQVTLFNQHTVFEMGVRFLTLALAILHVTLVPLPPSSSLIVTLQWQGT